jgi:hypothetical protein
MQSFSSRSIYTAVLASLSLATTFSLSAQTLSQSPASASTSSSSLFAADAGPQSASEDAALLPDAPGIAMLSTNASRASRSETDPTDHAGPAATNGLGSVTAEASHTQKYIEPGQAAPKLSASDKSLLGVRDAFSIFSASGWFASAGYEQLVNGSPNYGTDRGAFGQRLGAAAIRDITEGVFSDSIMSPLLHEDPRYYRLGPSHNIFVRAIYAGTRPLITRTDGGRMSPNLALIAGNAGGSALTNTYYPQLNRGFTQTLETFGGSMGGSALGDLVSEFYDDVIHPHRHQ